MSKSLEITQIDWSIPTTVKILLTVWFANLSIRSVGSDQKGEFRMRVCSNHTHSQLCHFNGGDGFGERRWADSALLYPRALTNLPRPAPTP